MAKNKGGRPKKVIDYDMVEKLASLMATQEEIAIFMDCCVKTLQRDDRFCRLFKKGFEKGKMSQRRKQAKLADKNASMAIWLGKQYLGQKDKSEVDNTHNFVGGVPEEYEDQYIL